jgi:acyl-coenzyme A synthetase/AMP-(fatty) acid ligase
VTLDGDGVNLQHIGRRDHMIKSRGYRIELGEIETAISAHEGVRKAAVIAVPDDLIGNRIKAFVVPVEWNGLAVQELQAHCALQLPRHMLPGCIEFVEGEPKTSTGKIERPFLGRWTNEKNNHDQSGEEPQL